MIQKKRRESTSGVGYYTCWDKHKPNGCIYCGRPANTREHIPSEFLFIDPLPENLQTIPACFECNNSFSTDEEYFICYLEVLKNKVYPDYVISEHVCRTLSQKPSLMQLIVNEISYSNGCFTLSFDSNRFSRVIKKYAIGHAGYEFDNLNFDGNCKVWYDFCDNISNEEIVEFTSPIQMDVIPEISSRFSCNACIIQNVEDGSVFVLSDWTVVQENRYSYQVYINRDNGVTVKMIILDYLYCQVDFY